MPFIGQMQRPLKIAIALLLPISFLVIFVRWELQSSRLYSRYLAGLARRLTFWVEPESSPSIRFPSVGPYDERLGYANIPRFIKKLHAKGYSLEAQARTSPDFQELVDRGLFPIYREKTQAGLSILAHDGDTIFAYRSPERVYTSYYSIPELIVNTLLFIENQELMDFSHPYRNPAIEWDRLTKAGIERTRKIIDWNHKVMGGSTLATQIEKYRHSPEGRTTTTLEKARQIASASIRSYLNGRETIDARRQIVLSYINSVPLAAIPGYGEVNGLGDGLWAWYGVGFEEVNRLLSGDLYMGNGASLEAQARAYRQVLSLFLAQRRPAYFLLENPSALRSLTNGYLSLLTEAGIISPVLRNLALTTELSLRRTAPASPEISFLNRKATNAIRTHLLRLLELPGLYDLDRLDLTVNSTLNQRAQEEISQLLAQLQDPVYVNSLGLRGDRMLNKGDPAQIVCSFMLYERTDYANLLRVHADNFDQPFDINEGTKLELGSTAKLRTLVTYLEVVADLHKRYVDLSPKDLRKVQVSGSDNLSQWAIQHLAATKNKSLPDMLEAAMQRHYSASPAEAFFTGDGLHTFSNFKSEDNGRVMSVREALQRSVNLVFIRLMRDIVHYYMFQRSDSTAQLFADTNAPSRQAYLARFADYEGRKFLERFYRKYRGKSPEEAMELLLQNASLTPSRLAAIYRSVEPEASIAALASFILQHLPHLKLPDEEISKLYESSSPAVGNLADRGSLARVHPLELWIVAYLRHHPNASLTEAIKASAKERQEVYAWLFSTQHKNTQDSRIRTILEIEAFEAIHRSWKRLGYPFEALVPSYATAIGSSADRPAALAELIGIILNNGVRQPTIRMERLRFAGTTPYETILKQNLDKSEQVLLPEIAAVLQQELIGVVEHGTAQRVRGAFIRPEGGTIAVGGKTGTGDNRYEIYIPGAGSNKSLIENRTATFVFFIGERFFGTITVFVSGSEARQYNFTSALPVEILKLLAPKLMPMINEASYTALSGQSSVRE
jgi:membrane peptidoglycan carboxypeptidase